MIFWLTVEFRGTGNVRTYQFPTALDRALAIISTALYAEVVAQGECGLESGELHEN